MYYVDWHVSRKAGVTLMPIKPGHPSSRNKPVDILHALSEMPLHPDRDYIKKTSGQEDASSTFSAAY
jgi:hypothetical protein